MAWFDYLLFSFAIVFFFDTLFVCSGDGRSAKQKAHAFLPCESIFLVVIVISCLSNLVGKDRLYSIGYAEIELDYTRESG